MTAPISNAQFSDRIYIGQGEYAVGVGPRVVIATLLGSCVSACLWDATAGVGGMNHVLFTDERADAAQLFGHGVNGMELLVNGMLHRGARRDRLKAKVFGGAKMISGLSDTGLRNGEFVCNILDNEGVEIVSSDLGGTRARRVEFWPGTGRARLKYVDQDVPVSPVLPVTMPGNDLELF